MRALRILGLVGSMVLVGAIGAPGCSSNEDSTSAEASSGTSGTSNGSTGSGTPSNGSASNGTSSGRSGGSTGDDRASTGDDGASTGNSGGATGQGNASTGSSGSGGSGSDHDAGGVDASASSDGGAKTGSIEAGTTAPFPDLAFAGLTSALELAPVRLAANGLYPARVMIGSGGVDNLFNANGPMIATNAETQALRASVQHPNLRIIFTVCEGLYRIVGKQSAGIHTLSDLKGKRIAVPSGTSSHYFLSRMLGVVNLTEQDVTILNQSPGMGILSADAATIWEPGIQYVADGLKSDAVEFDNAPQGTEVYRELFNLHATAETLADPQKRRGIVRFVKALIDASAQIRQDPTIVYPLLTGPTGESQADLEKSWKYERYAGTLVSDILDVLEREEPWRAKLDGRPARSRADLAPLVDDSVVREAMEL